jgi:hypothetical protein
MPGCITCGSGRNRGIMKSMAYENSMARWDKSRVQFAVSDSVTKKSNPMRYRVNVIAPDHEYGLRHSGTIVTGVLKEAGLEARFLHLDDGMRSRWRQGYLQGWFGKYMRRDINIFMEQLSPKFFPLARIQLLIPNQEWMREEDISYLSKIDLVVCKSRHAEEIFTKLGCPAAFSSFTSRDCRLGTGEPKRREFFLMAGNRLGIVDRVLALWSRHPEWPTLTISSRNIPHDLNLPNVCLIREYLPSMEIVRLQNAHLFHLCVTTAEGFGHKMNEAASCGAVVIATDGPPMNEVIRPERGLLVKWNKTSPKALGTEYHFDEEDLERTIQRCLGLAGGEIDELGANARRWFEENDVFFRRTLPEIVKNAVNLRIETVARSRTFRNPKK